MTYRASSSTIATASAASPGPGDRPACTSGATQTTDPKSNTSPAGATNCQHRPTYGPAGAWAGSGRSISAPSPITAIPANQATSAQLPGVYVPVAASATPTESATATAPAPKISNTVEGRQQ